MFYSETKSLGMITNYIKIHLKMFETLLLEKGEVKKHHFFLIIASLC